MKAENTYLITQPIFGVREVNGKKIIHHCSIINYGEQFDDKIKYTTRDGVQIENKHNLDNSIRLFKLEDICLDNLMSKWSRANNIGLPIVLDESIESQEVFEDKFSPLAIMIDRRKDCVAIKPLFV